MSTHVRDILESKNNKMIWCINKDRPVFDAIEIMSEKRIGALLVLDSNKIGNNKIAGILTERDYARKVILMNRSSKDTLVSDIMNKDVLYVTPDDTAESVMTQMTEMRVRYFPVLEGGALHGFISMGDVVRSIVSDREFLIEQLLCYITGTQNIDTSEVYKGKPENLPYRIL